MLIQIRDLGLLLAYLKKCQPTPLFPPSPLILLLPNSLGTWEPVLDEQINQVSGQDDYSLKAAISHMNSLVIGSITPLSSHV